MARALRGSQICRCGCGFAGCTLLRVAIGAPSSGGGGGGGSSSSSSTSSSSSSRKPVPGYLGSSLAGCFYFSGCARCSGLSGSGLVVWCWVPMAMRSCGNRQRHAVAVWPTRQGGGRGLSCWRGKKSWSLGRCNQHKHGSRPAGDGKARSIHTHGDKGGNGTGWRQRCQVGSTD